MRINCLLWYEIILLPYKSTYNRNYPAEFDDVFLIKTLAFFLGYVQFLCSTIHICTLTS